ncbi:MAG: lamin tail domain-containing protein, partial [Bacteroidota bacterium]
WYNSGPYYSINPRNQADILSTGPADARIVGSMTGWSTTDPDYVMALNANGLYELTKSLDAGDHEYKVIEGDTWGDPNYPGNNQHVILTATENVTWKTNTTADLVTHLNPVVAGSFLSAIGGTDWDPAELMGEMTDPDGDDIFELVLTIPAGNYEGKVTLNHNWDQSTGGNVAFETDGVTPTTFTYDFPNNTTTISGPPPPTATITFIVNDVTNMNYDGFFLKGSWDGNGQYDPSWGGGMEHSEFYDDGTHGDVTADDNIWTCQQDLVVDAGSNTWEWGVNDSESNWVAGNWQFTIPDQTAQTLTWTVPDVVDLVINEIMYNSPGTDEEWIELYNNTDQTIDLENYDICDNNASHTHIIIPAGYSIAPGGFFTISIATGGAFPFTPDYDGTGNFALNNGGDAVRVWNPSYILVDIVVYDDYDPWPTEPDGDGPTLSLIHPDLDNSLAESWAPSNQDGGTPGAFNFPIVLTAPNGGELIELGSVFDIEWTVEDWDGSIKIELLQEGVDPVLIVSNLPVTNQSFAWSVFGAEVASDYKIQITNMDDDNPFDASDDFFSILEEYIMPEIVITEIMYNPPESGTDSLEFLELYNNGDETVNLEGFYFTEGIEFIFPNVDLLPDNYLLVSVNSAAMMSTFGVDALQWTSGGLSNGGEDIVLRDSYDIIIDSLTYDDHLPWDTLADGYGPSLTLCNPDVDNSVAENWTHSVNFAAVNSVGDSIWATPGFGCQIEFLAGFEADVTVISVGESVLFTDLTIGDPTEWTWTFEGGTPDTYFGQTPPPVFYDTEGDWDVTLLVTDGTNTDEITYVDYISVLDFPAPTNLVGVVGPYDDVQLTWDGFATLGFEDDFESYDDFVLEFMPWTNVDVDGSTTYGMTDVDWPNAYAEQSFIIFNPAQTTPPVDDIIPHSGDKLAACFAATAPPNDDWLMTPLVGIGSAFNLTFWAKSYTADYGLERFRVGVSTTGLDPGDFTIISEGDYVEAPVEEWTQFTYDLSAYDGQNIYVAVQCVSNDAFILLVDDFYIGASKSHTAFNNNVPVIGKGTKSVSFTATPSNYVAATTTGRSVAAELLGYNVYRDDVQINAAIVEVTEYNDAEPTIGSHDYFVTAVYDGGESDPSNVVSIVVTDINDVTSTSVAIYPNPTNGIFTIEYADEKTADIVVMDITGKEVYTSSFIGTTQVNLLGLQKGLYLVRLLDKSTNEIIVKKLLVK